MPLKILILFTNVLAVKVVFSQTIYSTAPTCTYMTNPVPTSYPVNISPSSATVTTLPASTVTAFAQPRITTPPLPTTSPSVTLTASPIPSSTPTTFATSTIPKAITASNMPSTIDTSKPTVTPVSSMAGSTMPAATIAASYMPTATISSTYPPTPTITASPMPSASATTSTSAKAYFLPGPVPDPKVTILTGDMPSVIEVKPRIANPGVIEVSPKICADTGLIEVPTASANSYTATAVTSNAKLPMTARKSAQDRMAPTKRLSMACDHDDPFASATKSPFLPNQQPVCPGISKIDSTPIPCLTRNNIKNPIDFDGLLDGFLTCL